ncbi:hypothetical protein PY95_08940 [Lacticaseibacillus rhamnosus]|nr:hypothetical protein PY95_08940 [Lacticaseibacillus rhamnosus]OAU00246.1 hypothetical protein PY72_08940 [Lacticaseibacillus rhamnosus]
MILFSGFFGLGWKEKLFAEMTLQNSKLVCKDPIGWWVGFTPKRVRRRRDLRVRTADAMAKSGPSRLKPLVF